MEISNLGQPSLQGGLLDSVLQFVGVDRDASQKTLNAAIPTAMYSFADHGSSEIGARSLLDGLKSGQAPQLEVSQLGNLLANPHASDHLMTTSVGFLEKVFGSRIEGILGALSSYGGSDLNTTSKLLALAAPLALNVIGKRARTDNLDARGLAGFLAEQKVRVAAVLPGPVRQSLGLQPAELIPKAMPPVAKAPPVRVETPRREIEARAAAARLPEKEPARWPLYLLGLAALLGIGWLLSRAFHPRPVGTRQVTARINFDTGRSDLNADGRRIAGEVANILIAHPRANARIEGSSDSTTANLALGQARADSVKDALTSRGVQPRRVTTGAAQAGNRAVEITIRQ